MKAYRYNYDSPGTTSYGNYLIAENEEEAKKIALQRIDWPEHRVNLNMHEISIDKIMIKDLTAGDLMRLLTCLK